MARAAVPSSRSPLRRARGFPLGEPTVEARARRLNGLAVLFGPCGEGHDGLDERAPEFGEFVVDARRGRGRHGARHQAVSLEAAECERQHPLRDPIDRSTQLAETHRSVSQESDHQHAPFIADPVEDLADRTVLRRSSIRLTSNGHRIPRAGWRIALRRGSMLARTAPDGASPRGYPACSLVTDGFPLAFRSARDYKNAPGYQK